MLKIFSLPTFQDSEKTRKAKIFFRLVWGLVGILTFYMVVNLMILPNHSLRWVLFETVLISICILTLWLNANGYVRTASLLFICFCLIHIFGLAWTAGGIKAPVIQTLPVFVLIAGLLLGWKEGLVISILASAGGLALVFANQWGYLPINKVTHTPLSIWVYTSMYIAIIALFQFFSTEGLNKALRKSHKELDLRKKAEDALRGKTALLEAQVNSTSDGILVIDENQKRLITNQQFIQLCEIPKHIMETDDDTVLLSYVVGLTKHPESFLEKVMDLYNHPFETSLDEVELKNGMILQRYSAPVLGTNNENYGRIWTFRDITKSKCAERALKKSEERLKTAQQIALLGNWELTFSTNQLSWSDLLFKIYEVDPNQVESLYDTFIHAIHPEDRETVHQSYAPWLKHPAPFEITHRLLMPDSRIKYIHERCEVYYDTNGIPLYSIGTVQDITEIKVAEIELNKYRTQLELLVKERTEELHATIEELNSTNEELFNQKEELQNTINALNDAQVALIQSEKMASLGILSAGIAHEINNPLNFIHGGILALETYFKTNLPEHYTNVDKLINAVNVGVIRASEIVTSLSHYSRNDNLPKINCNLHSIIDNCLIMLQNQLKPKVEVLKKYCETPPVVFGNEGKLHQVILNIIANAQQSITEKGAIHITTEVAKNYIWIIIKDTGCGIKPEHMPKIFDPFFTTKETGKGTGLGLSITYNIIREHNGTIHFDSQEGIGTKVTIKIPIAKD